MNVRQLVNVLGSTIGESPRNVEIPEGHLYAASMAHADLDTFTRAVDVLVAIGLLKRLPGHVLVGTDKLYETIEKIKAVR